MFTVDDVLNYIEEETLVNAKIYEHDCRWCIETEYRSSLGEDVVDDILFDEFTGKSLLKALNDSIFYYDKKCNEYIEMYIRCIPHWKKHFSPRELIDDADWKIEFWNNFVFELNKHFDWRY